MLDCIWVLEDTMVSFTSMGTLGHVLLWMSATNSAKRTQIENSTSKFKCHQNRWMQRIYSQNRRRRRRHLKLLQSNMPHYHFKKRINAPFPTVCIYFHNKICREVSTERHHFESKGTNQIVKTWTFNKWSTLSSRATFQTIFRYHQERRKDGNWVGSVRSLCV